MHRVLTKLAMLSLLAMLSFMIGAVSSRRGRKKAAAAKPTMPADGAHAGVLPGLGFGPLHTVGPIGLFDDKGMGMVMASNGRAMVKFDPPGYCKACAQIDKIWDMVAAERPGRAWRVNCGEHPTVCLLRRVNASELLTAGTALVNENMPSLTMRVPEPSLQMWDGKEKVFWRYIGLSDAPTLMDWLVGCLTGRRIDKDHIGEILAEKVQDLVRAYYNRSHYIWRFRIGSL
jgi:hypothetical protein